MAYDLDYYRRFVYAAAYRFMRGHPFLCPVVDADDVAQNALFEIWRILELEPDLPPELVMWRMKRRMADIVKKRYPRTIPLEEVDEDYYLALPSPDPGPEERATYRELLNLACDMPGFSGFVAQQLADEQPTNVIADNLHISERSAVRYRRKIKEFMKSVS